MERSWSVVLTRAYPITVMVQPSCLVWVYTRRQWRLEMQKSTLLRRDSCLRSATPHGFTLARLTIRRGDLGSKKKPRRSGALIGALAQELGGKHRARSFGVELPLRRACLTLWEPSWPPLVKQRFALRCSLPCPKGVFGGRRAAIVCLGPVAQGPFGVVIRCCRLAWPVVVRFRQGTTE
jgi:hypothetical protein